MDASKPESAKQLKEHLQHQQEPFSLHDYLSERSYMFKNFSSDSCNIHSLYSGKNLKRSIKCDLHNIRKRLLEAKGMVRSLLCKFVLAGDEEEFSNWDGQHKSDQYVHRTTSGTQRKPKYGFSSMKTLAASDNFTYNDVEDDFLPYEHHGSALMNVFRTFTLPEFRRLEESAGDPMFPTYVRKLLMNLDIAKMGRARNDKLQMFRTAPLCRRKKRILQKRKQQLFDCVEKAKEFHENEGKKLSIKTVSEFEDLENIIHEHFCLMEIQYEELKKTTHLLHTESFTNSEEWSNSDKLSWDIQMEIGDAIMDDIIRDIIDLFLD